MKILMAISKIFEELRGKTILKKNIINLHILELYDNYKYNS